MDFFDVNDALSIAGKTDLYKSGISGKYDNVYKYWESVELKTVIRRSLLSLLQKKDSVKIVDLGCGIGEGYILLSQIPLANKTSVQNNFVLGDSRIEKYLGIDKSSQAVKTGKELFAETKNTEFIAADLSKTTALKEESYDVYFSNHSALSFLSSGELGNLIESIFEYNTEDFLLVFDFYGKYSPEWPNFWGKKEFSAQLNQNKNAGFFDKFAKKYSDNKFVRLWDSESLSKLFLTAAEKFRRSVSINLYDRAILVGRHIESGLYNKHPQKLRTEINRLFERDYRGSVENLFADVSFLNPLKEEYPVQYNRIIEYCNLWNSAISFLDALISEKKVTSDRLIDEAPSVLKEELQMLKWLEGNSSRFPVVDFWGSIMGPQVACVLRNLEMNLTPGTGAGSRLVCLVEVNKK